MYGVNIPTTTGMKIMVVCADVAELLLFAELICARGQEVLNSGKCTGGGLERTKIIICTYLHRFVEVGIREICGSGIGVRQSPFGIVIPSARSTTTLLRKVGFIDIVGHDVYRDFFVAIKLI